MFHSNHRSRYVLGFVSALLSACGGGGVTAGTPAVSLNAGGTAQGPQFIGQAMPGAANPNAGVPPVVPTTIVAARLPSIAGVDVQASVIAIGMKLTDMRVRSTAAGTQTQVPVTFGQVFLPGALLASESLTGQLNNGFMLPLQLDVKATHPDGSVRHAIISTTLPSLAPNQTQSIALIKIAGSSSRATGGPTPADVLATGFNTGIDLHVDGQTYHAAIIESLAAGQYTTWLAGRHVGEWLINAPLKTARGLVHPHLQARVALRAGGAPLRVRVDVTIENDWAYEAAPRNQTYDIDLQVDGRSVYAKSALVHYRQARWRKVFWSGGAPALHVMHDPAYLIASRTVPNYDQAITIAETALAGFESGNAGPATEPMATGMATRYMGEPGARPDIGLLPGWAAATVLSMDQRAKEAMLGTANLAGSWSSHYRDRVTDRPVSLLDHPYMTLLGNRGDTVNPATGLPEAFPDCPADCSNPNFADSAHQPGFSYLPYLLTGDFYHLEELQFWTMYNLFQSNPGYRENIKGLFNRDQVRGQAWSMRTLAEAAFITPDTDPLKPQFQQFMANNLDWYNKTYTDNPSANRLSVITSGYAVVYDDNLGLAPWQDDFFTQAIGHVADLGFPKATSLLAWKSRFPIGRMTDSDYCWILGAVYSMKVRATPTSDLYASFGEAYRASAPAGVAGLACASSEMATKLGLRIGEMIGYAYGETGYPSNLQPALAYAADAGGSAGLAAWKVFNARKIKPDYSASPQFAILPRRSDR